MGDDEVKEASWVVQSVAGASAYIHGIDYDHAKFMQEVDAVVAHVKSSQ